LIFISPHPSIPEDIQEIVLLKSLWRDLTPGYVHISEAGSQLEVKNFLLWYLLLTTTTELELDRAATEMIRPDEFQW